MKARRFLISAALALVVAAMPRVGHAQGLAVASMHVGARVAPTCSIIVEVPAADADPSVHVTCARSGLRALKVSTEAGGSSVVKSQERQLLAGGEETFTVLSPLTVVASREPLSTLPRPSETAAIVVTLHF